VESQRGDVSPRRGRSVEETRRRDGATPPGSGAAAFPLKALGNLTFERPPLAKTRGP